MAKEPIGETPVELIQSELDAKIVELEAKDILVKEKDIIILEKEVAMEILIAKTRPRSLGFYRSRFK